MKTIWKYEVPIKDSFSIQIPEGGKILSLQTQKGTPYIWILVDQSRRNEQRNFRYFGTGFPIENPIDSNLLYIGSVLIQDEVLVFHLFEERN